jgi:hypothetical protein
MGTTLFTLAAMLLSPLVGLRAADAPKPVAKVPVADRGAVGIRLPGWEQDKVLLWG